MTVLRGDHLSAAATSGAGAPARVSSRLPLILALGFFSAAAVVVSACVDPNPAPIKEPIALPTATAVTVDLTAAPTTGGPGPLPPPATGIARADQTRPTNVVDYVPQRPAGEARAGSCWANSQTVPSRAAWRCESANQTLDPCFNLGNEEVVCNANPLTANSGIVLKLSEPLPKADLLVERASSPWLVQLDDGTTCSLATGATGLVDGKRISYFCGPADKDGNRVVILGEPRSGMTWYAERATVGLRDGKLVATAAQVPLSAVLRGPATFAPFTCGPLADAMAILLGAAVTRGEGPLFDPVTGDSGTGCQATAASAGLDLASPPADLLRKMLAVQGWREDGRYQIGGLDRAAAGFRNGNALCLLSAGWTGIGGVAAGGQPGGAVVPAVERQQYVVQLSCAADHAAAGEPEVRRPARERIEFAPGAIDGIVRRRIAGGEVQEYVLRAFAGQTMRVDITAPNEDVVFTAIGLEDGTSLVGPDESARRWQGKLPASQEYLLRVAARGQNTEFSLRVVIPPQ